MLMAGVAFGCARHQPQPVAPGLEFELPLGQAAAVSGGPVVTFREVIEDSRCPIDAICIQAGRATVRLTLAQGGTTRDLVLATREGREADTSGQYEIRLLSLLPPRSAAAPLPADAYRVTLLIDSTK